MPQEYNTNFIRSDGTDMGKVLLTREYLLAVYPQIAGQFVTPELWVWGRNNNLQLGINESNGNGDERSIPITTWAGGANWKQVACGTDHMAAIKTDGTLWTWGKGGNGQLGTNTVLDRSTPVTTFAGGTNWKQVSCGSYHTAAIKTDGSLWIWGNGSGELGNNTSTNANTPVTTFAGGNNWKQVSAGSFQTAAIKTDGTLWVWGFNGNGQLGINVAGTRSTPVTTFVGGNDWKVVIGGNALKTNGTLWQWNSSIASTPVTIFSGTDWKSISAGNAAIKTDGTLWTWGTNTQGQLGTNDTIFRSTPVTTFAGGNTWKQVVGGSGTILAIKTDGTLWTWGSGSFGQLGDNSTRSRSTPVTTFIGGNNWKTVAADLNLSIAAIRSSEEL